ncbi:MAG: hypothetical protein ACU0BB_16910 [Paracoccaceae bacterium]
MTTTLAFADTTKAARYDASKILTSFEDNDPSKHEELIIEDGRLKVVGDGEGIGWFSDSQGPLLYKDVTGDFMIQTEVSMHRKDGEAGLPEGNFSSAGLLVRAPGGTQGNENWLMFNIGFQNRFYGRELKVTRPMDVPKEENPLYDVGFHSLSTLYLLPEENTEPMKLRVARIGDELRTYYFTAGKGHEQALQQGMEVFGNGINKPVSEFGNGQFRPNGMNLPETVQAGIMVNAGIDEASFAPKRDGYALFSYIEIAPISNFV